MASIFVARGLLIESTDPVWLYGTASEHAVFYQYNFHNARNIFAGLLQTESPYFQPTPPPPAPFQDVLGKLPGDPDYSCAAGDEFNGCDESWSIIMRGSANIFVAGAGLYTWFSTYSQSCIDGHTCQKVLVLLSENYNNVRFQNLVTIGAKYMAVMEGQGISALDNLNVNTHPSWSQISVLDVRGNGKDFHELYWIDPKIWDMEQPAFTCAPPCRVKIPPWTKATTTIDYPVLTVTQGATPSYVFAPPVVVSKWFFEDVTLEAGADALQRRQAFTDFYPVPATVSAWPAVTYTGAAGGLETTRADVPFPTPTIGPGANAPPEGNWPQKPVRPIVGRGVAPLVVECAYGAPSCQGWQPDIQFGEMGGAPWDSDPDPLGELGDDAYVTCEAPSSSTSTTSTQATATTTEAPPEESPLERGHARQNRAPGCYNRGKAASHERLENAVNSFCRYLGSGRGSGLQTRDVVAGEGGRPVFRDEIFRTQTEPFNDNLEVVLEFQQFDGCEWDFSFDECKRYLMIPIDSCDCNGVNGKHGGTVENNCYRWRIDPNSS